MSNIETRLSEVGSKSCPLCGQKKLRIEYRLKAKPLGTFSLSGAQLKTVATTWPWMVCDGCKAEAPGKFEE